MNRPSPVVTRQDPWRFLAIAIVFALGASMALPGSAQAQVSASLSGTVTDADGGPLADAVVVAKKPVSGSLYEYHETTTDKEGAYSLAGLSAGAWQVTVRRDGYRTNATGVDLGVGAAGNHSVALQPLNVAYYKGQVLDASNQAPIGGARVLAEGYGGGEPRETTTAGDGSFQVRLFGQETRITISKSGYGTYHDWVYQPNGDIERTVWLNAVPPQSATVTGKVVDQATGAPLQAYVEIATDWSSGGGDCCVAYAEPASDVAYSSPMPYHGNYNSTVTAADGTFTMKGYPGDVVVSANRQGYLVASERHTLTDGGTVTITFSLVKLPERTVTLSGVVNDKLSGKPVHGASVSVQVPGAGDYQWASTDESGAFSVQVRPGYTLVEVSYWGYRYVYEDVVYATDDAAQEDTEGNATGASPAEPEPASRPIAAPQPPQDGKQYYPVYHVLTTAADERREIEIALEPKPEPQGVLLGYVIDATTDQAIAGARVSLQNHATGDWGEATTDENGSYRFLAYGGYHSVRVYAPGFLPYATNVQVPAEGTARADLTVQPGEQANEGWWSPGDGAPGGGPTPYPMPAYAEDASMGASAPSASSSGSRTAESGADGGSGAKSLIGSGGGLPAYDPGDSGETFSTGRESPGLGAFAVVSALGVLALVAGLRRRP